jgi:hypothetical protein
MQRLAALVPRPRLNLIRFHGALAPNAKLRPQIIPGRPASVPDDLGDASHHPVSAHMSWAQLLTKPPGAVLNGQCRPAATVLDVKHFQVQVVPKAYPF